MVGIGQDLLARRFLCWRKGVAGGGLGSRVCCCGFFFLFLSEMLREGSSREGMGFVMGLRWAGDSWCLRLGARESLGFLGILRSGGLECLGSAVGFGKAWKCSD